MSHRIRSRIGAWVSAYLAQVMRSALSTLVDETETAAQLRHEHAINLAHELSQGAQDAAQRRHEHIAALLGHPTQDVDVDPAASGLLSAEALERLRVR